MPRISSGKRYAQAAFELALERNELESWQEGLKRIADLTGEEELMSLLGSPRIPFDVKKDILKKRLGEIPPLILNLALLLIYNGLLRISLEISNQFNELLDKYKGIERAKVITAIHLSDEDRKMFEDHLGKFIDRKVYMDTQVDPSIIGGFIARIGDIIIDGSIRQRLDLLKKSLIEAGR